MTSIFTVIININAVPDLVQHHHYDDRNGYGKYNYKGNTSHIKKNDNNNDSHPTK